MRRGRATPPKKASAWSIFATSCSKTAAYARQLGREREIEQVARLAEREVKRARGIERDRGYGWSR